MKRLIFILIAMFFSTTVLTSCTTTAMYTRPSVVDAANNIYSFTIEKPLISGSKASDERAIKEIKEFMKKHGYKRYKIIERTVHFTFYSGIKYKVKFYK